MIEKGTSSAFTAEQLDWAKLAFDHVRIGDFEGAIALIQQEPSRPLLKHLAWLIHLDGRTSSMDVTEVTNAIERQTVLAGLH